MVESSPGIVISYETLFEILRKEKNRDEIQELPKSFFENVIKYLDEKKASLKRVANPGYYNQGAIPTQLDNAVRLVREIYERREKKILLLAVNKARTDSNIIDTSNLLPEEKKMFDSLVCELRNFRQGILDSVLAGKTPQFSVCVENKTEEKKAADGSKLIKITKEVPRFMGKDYEEYGPFEEGREEELPIEVADLLIRKGHASEI